MLSALKGGSLWAALVILLAVIGAVTYLTSAGFVSGSDALTVIVVILTAVTGVTSAHVAGQTAAAAFNTPAPVNGGAAPLAQPAPGADASSSAMPS